ncbi:MAG: T9SS type A sorting domain-containing protein [Ignavibacteriales bacterium]|nr:T9SS type A sorting domain-containing protein [Ignavibacteriales bacterium]
MLQLFAVVCVALASTVSAKETVVSSAGQIATAIASIAPGDTLTMVSGIWNNQAIVFKATGTASHPILLRAQSNQSTILTGTSTLRIAGEYLIVDGLKFENGYSPSGAIIEFRGLDGSESRHCRLTRTSIKSYNPSNDSIDYKWVSLYGQYNQVDHCALEGKTHLGTTLVVWLSATPNYHQIDHNYFGPRPLLVDKNGAGLNGGETIRVGTSDWSMYDSFTTIEYNLFDQCNGEIEIISSKSCGNIYRYNTFRSCQGTLTLRHGNRCLVEGNFFLCNNAQNSGGVRIIGEDHKVFNNYIEKSAGASFKSGITLMNGVPNSPLNRYFQVKRAVVVFNTLVDNVCSLNIGAGKDAELTLPPMDCVIADNIVWSTHAPLVTYSDTPVNMKYEGNIFYGTTLGIAQPSGIRMVNPALVYGAGTDSLWRISSASAAKDSAVGSYPFVTNDVDGQLRTAPYDIGADEYNTTPIVRRPLAKGDVGPQSMTTPVIRDLSGAPDHRSLMRLMNYPNPFNPTTVFRYQLPAAALVEIKIFDIMGREVETLVQQHLTAGRHEVSWTGPSNGTGVYFCRLQSGGEVRTTKIVLMR